MPGSLDFPWLGKHIINSVGCTSRVMNLGVVGFISGSKSV